jgi:hypothetical protein
MVRRAAGRLMQNIGHVLNRLSQSTFRQRFRLGAKEQAYLRIKGRDAVREHARGFIATRLASAHPRNDGKQTPMRGHPIFIAQHATATCCRGCLAKWHGIAMGAALSEAAQAHVLAVIETWLDAAMPACADAIPPSSDAVLPQSPLQLSLIRD